jgi:hypothetical protein
MLRFNTKIVIKSQLASKNGRKKILYSNTHLKVCRKKSFPKTETVLCNTLNLLSSVWYS